MKSRGGTLLGALVLANSLSHINSLVRLSEMVRLLREHCRVSKVVAVATIAGILTERLRK